MSELSASDAARALGAQRKLGSRVCVRCGRGFEGLSYAKYCSRVCSNAAFYAAHASELRAGRKERYQRGKGGE